MKIDHAEIAKRLLAEEKSLRVTLQDLVGEFQLTGVSRDDTQVASEWDEDRYEDSQIFSFILNDITFTAVEDPDDGYRSHMRYIAVEQFAVRSQFHPVDVYTIYRTDNTHLKEDNDDYFSGEVWETLEMYDKGNDKLIMRVGTNNADDYYPYFVAEWMPENMEVNGG
jgi:hypothetical protein